jgi:hypothetical protein
MGSNWLGMAAASLLVAGFASAEPLTQAAQRAWFA